MSDAVFWPLAFVLWIAAVLLVGAALERREWIFRYKCTLCNGRPMIATAPLPTSHLVGGLTACGICWFCDQKAVCSCL